MIKIGWFKKDKSLIEQEQDRRSGKSLLSSAYGKVKKYQANQKVAQKERRTAARKRMREDLRDLSLKQKLETKRAQIREQRSKHSSFSGGLFGMQAQSQPRAVGTRKKSRTKVVYVEKKKRRDPLEDMFRI